MNRFNTLYDSLYLEFLSPLGAAATGDPAGGAILTLRPPKHRPKRKKNKMNFWRRDARIKAKIKAKKDKNDQDWGNINFEGKKKEPKVRRGKLGTGTTGPDTGTKVHRPKKGKGSYKRHDKHQSGISIG